MGVSVRRKCQKNSTAQKRNLKAKVSPTASSRTRRSPPQIRRLDESKVGFGDLPAELRNQIYELALTRISGAAIRIVQPSPGEVGRDIALGLLASCKAVRNEAWSFFYERNEFRVDCVYQNERPSYEQDMTHGVTWRDHIVFDGYDFTPKYTSHTTKSYQKDLDRFLTATNYKLGLQSMRTISFAYYHNEDQLPKDKDGNVLSFPERADVVIVLKLLSKLPFFSVEIDNALSSKWLNSASKAKILAKIQDYMIFTIDPTSGAKKMCKTIMIDFLAQSHTAYTFP